MREEYGSLYPFSLINALEDSKISNHWFQSGTPYLLIEVLKKSNFNLLELRGIEIDESSFADYSMNVDNPIPLFYQSGYLTIKSYNPANELYTLDFPNDEVHYGFLKYILPFYSGLSTNRGGSHIGHFATEVQSGDVDAFMQRLQVFFANIPYDLNDQTE